MQSPTRCYILFAVFVLWRFPGTFSRSAQAAMPAAQVGASASNSASGELSASDKKKLAALDAALKSGALTEGEYAAKRNALFAGARNSSSPNRTSASWQTHNDTAGFSVELPASWNLSRDIASGSVTILGQRGERVVIWPMVIGQRLDPRGASALLQQFARKVDGGMSWGMPASSSTVVRAMGRSGQRSATALLSWSAATNGTTACLYYVGANTDSYRGSTDSFVRILRSFHTVQDPSLTSARAPGNSSQNMPLTFATWNDPHEGAFSTSVPQGWRAIGGTYRLSATDVRYALTMDSPDGQVRAAIGDSNIGVFTQPTQMLAYAGLREGGYYQLGDGTRMEIRRYIPGPQFARAYVESYVARQCPGLHVDSNNPRQDLTATFSQAARNEGATSAQLSAGDVSVTCNLNGVAVQGKYVTATALIAPGASPMWVVYRLYGYLAAPSRQQDGEGVVTQAMQSWKFNPQWEAQQKGIANSAVQQDNMRSQQIQSRALQAIAEDQRQTSETITKGYEERSKIYDEISRKRENAILGTLDVVDPETGTQYKVSNYGDYHYMDNSGYIYSTNSPNSPGPDLRELITLP